MGKDDTKPLAVYPLNICAIESEHRHASDAALDVDAAGDPSTPLVSSAPSPVRVSALFSAIASDSFFELMASQHLTLSSPSRSESDLSSVGSPITSLSSATSSRISTTTFSHDLVEFDVDVNRYVDSFGKTLLHDACRFGNLQIAQCLLFHGASASAQCPHGRTPFHDAVSSRSEHTLDLLRLLYEHEPAGMAVVDVNGGHVLHLAAIHGRLDVIQWCASLRRDSGKKPPTATVSAEPLDAASPPTTHRFESGYLLPLAITSFGGRNMLHYAAYNGRLEVLKWLLKGPDNDRKAEFDVGAMDSNGFSLVHFAAMGGHLDVCQWLVLDAPGRKNVAINAANCEGKRAIDLAKHDLIKEFLAIVGRCARPPSALRCIGADHCSLGIAWTIELEGDARVRDVLAPTQLSLEYCRKPVGLSYAAGASVLAMLMTTARSQNLLRWEHVDVLIPPTATEYWLPGLEEATEYLVRMRSMNRNGFSEYSYPSVSGGFSTTANCSMSLPVDTRLASILHHVSFVGDLRFELLEGRELAALPHSQRGTMPNALPSPGYPLSPRRYTSSTAPDPGRYYCVVSVGLPGRGHLPPASSLEMGQQSRRRTVPMGLAVRHDISPPLSPSTSASTAASPTWRQLYCIQSRPSGVQESMMCAGSMCAARHPEFGFATTFRVPDPSLALVRIEIRCETKQFDFCVGVVTLRMVDLVRGLPLKTQWLTLEPPTMGPSRNVVTNDVQGCGYLLIRTMFLTDGASEAATHAALASADASRHSTSFSEATRSSGQTADISTASSHGSTAPRLYTPQGPVGTVALDEFGFRVIDPKLHFVRGKWQHRDDVTPCNTYSCYEQLRVSMDHQQARKWERLQASMVAVDSASGGDSGGDDAAACSAIFECTAAESANDGTTSDAEHQKSVKEAVQAIAWRGFPSNHRAAIYSQIAMRKRRVYPSDYYARLVEKAANATTDPASTQSARSHPSSNDDATNLEKPQVGDDEMPPPARMKFLAARKQLAGDLQRTFAGNQSWINTSEGQRTLGRVLEAYAVHNSAVGYCQSMTFIVGRLLCLFHHYRRRQTSNGARHQCIHPLPINSGDLDSATRLKSASEEEEDAFWVAVVLFDNMFPTYFTSGMRGLQADACVLEELVRTRLPQLDRHFQRLQAPHVGLLLTTHWLLPVFCAGFPTHTTFRVLDVLLQEGSAVIFPISIALLRIAQPELLAEHIDYMHVFRALKARDQRLHDAALLMEIAHDEFQLLPPSMIATLRNRFAQEKDTLDTCKPSVNK